MKSEEGRDIKQQKEILSKFYNIGWERYWEKTLDKDYNPLNKPYKNRMLDTLSLISMSMPRNAKFTLLDVGCGIGIYAINILKVFPNCTLLAFDISKEQIDFSNRKLVELPFRDRALFFVADVENFNLKERKFDFIICTEVLEHLPNPSKALKNIYEHGNKETKFIFSVPSIYSSGKSGWFYRQFITKNKYIETQDFSKIYRQKEYYEFYHKQYSKREIINLVDTHKFRVTEYRQSCFTLFKNKYFNYVYSLFAHYKLDKFLVKVTLNKFASQITLLCRK